ncbi:MAG: hypothetical protein AAF717_18615 [Bacteroidota bacterium]
MEEIYSKAEIPRTCKIAKARPETISFLLAFSKSYEVATYKNLKFERTLN